MEPDSTFLARLVGFPHLSWGQFEERRFYIRTQKGRAEKKPPLLVLELVQTEANSGRRLLRTPSIAVA